MEVIITTKKKENYDFDDLTAIIGGNECQTNL